MSVDHTRVRRADLLYEALAAAMARPLRASFTVLASAIGIAALLATLGITQSASAHLLAQFDSVAAAEVVVTPVSRSGVDPGPADPVTRHPEREIARLRGAIAAGALTAVEADGLLTSALPPGTARDARQIEVFAASPGIFDVVRGSLSHGRAFDAGHDRRADRVAVLGRRAAERLGVTRVDQQPAIFIGDEAFTVLGILEDVERETGLLGSVIVPRETARQRFGSSGTDRVVIETEPGAARMIGGQAPLVLAPEHPERLQAEVPEDLSELREQATRDVNALYLLLAGIALVIGAFGIASSTLVSIHERTGEIGLRRALGATRQLIVVQVLIEGTVLGVIGGLVGSAAGTLTVVATALVRGWPPVLDTRLVVLAPVVGLLVGLLAGAYPAVRAGRLEPVDGLREGV